MYNVAFTGIVVVAIVKFVDLDQVTIIVLRAVGVLWGSFFCSLAFVLPRWLEVRKQKLIVETLQGRNKSFLPSRVRSYLERQRSSTPNVIDTTEANHSSANKPKSILKTSEAINDDGRKSNNNNESFTDPRTKIILPEDMHKSPSKGCRRTSELTTGSKFLTWETEVEGAATSEVCNNVESNHIKGLDDIKS
jgi:hypothetical protein